MLVSHTGTFLHCNAYSQELDLEDDNQWVNFDIYDHMDLPECNFGHYYFLNTTEIQNLHFLLG